MATEAGGNEEVSANGSSADAALSVKFRCPTCGRYFLNEEEFDAHSKTHSKTSKGSWYMCTICEFTSTKKAYVIKHVGRKHPTILLKFKCKDCDEEFLSLKFLKQHKKEKHSGNYECQFCKHIFTRKKDMTMHQKLRHSENYEKNFKCLTCGEAFVYAHYLKRHEDRYKGQCYIEGHDEGQPYVCEVCNKAYIHLDTYRKHCQLHKDREFECPVCHAALISEKSLKTHMSRHKDAEKGVSYKCGLCDKTYALLQSLNFHLERTHNAPKLYVCVVCDAYCQSRSDLIAHRRTHFECIVCGKRCISEARLEKHRELCSKNESEAGSRHSESSDDDQLFDSDMESEEEDETVSRKRARYETDEEEDDDSLDELLFKGKVGESSASSSVAQNPNDFEYITVYGVSDKDDTT